FLNDYFSLAETAENAEKDRGLERAEGWRVGCLATHLPIQTSENKGFPLTLHTLLTLLIKRFQS
ncbi:MAG TPA: hypothetical protein PLT06_10190, partial [Syntrophorhabdaceae bacterium]|nr:hypothetical protein [Syntrophorhabdaceae bacterium]